MNRMLKSIQIPFLFSTLLLFFTFSQTLYSQSGKKRGKIRVRHPNGQLAEKGRVRNYQKQGLWNYWDTTGVLIRQNHFVDGQLNGIEIDFFSNKQKKREGSYQNNLQQGNWKEWYAGGAKKAETIFHNGKLDGEQKEWFENGTLRQFSIYKSGDLIHVKKWLDNGRILNSEYYRNGLKQGEWREYSQIPTEDTTTVSIRNFNMGKPDGAWLLYKQGLLLQEEYYSDSLLNGHRRHWNSKGQLLFDENYSQGLLQGQQNYYSDGILVRSEYYQMGLRNGAFDVFDSFNGKRIKTSWYANDHEDSSATWHSNGIIAGIKRFTSATLPYSYEEYDENKTLLLRGNYKNNMRDGLWISYYPNGKRKSETIFVDGQVNGIYRRWYANGKLMLETVYVGNQMQTRAKVWNEKGQSIPKTNRMYEAIIESNLPGEIYNAGASGRRSSF